MTTAFNWLLILNLKLNEDQFTFTWSRIRSRYSKGSSFVGQLILNPGRSGKDIITILQMGKLRGW